MKQIIILFTGIMSILMINCKGPEIITVPVHDSTFIESSETITDNPTWTDPDSLLLRFAFECDSAYNVILKQLSEANSGISSKVEIRKVPVYYEDGRKVTRLQLDISAYVDSLEMKNRTIERLKNENRVQQVPYPVPGPEVKYIPKYHKFTAWAFPIENLLIILLFILWLKSKKFRSFL